MINGNIIFYNKENVLYCQGQCKVICNMAYDRKLIRNGNGWAMTLNSTILELLDVDPKINKVRYTIENNTLKITKSPNLIENSEQV